MRCAEAMSMIWHTGHSEEILPRTNARERSLGEEGRLLYRCRLPGSSRSHAGLRLCKMNPSCGMLP